MDRLNEIQPYEGSRKMVYVETFNRLDKPTPADNHINYFAVPGLIVEKITRVRPTGIAYKRDVEAERPRQFELKHILSVTSQTLGVDIETMKGLCRKGHIVAARHIFCYLAYKHSLKTPLTGISGTLERDHSTAINSIKKVVNAIETKQGALLSSLQKVESRLLNF